MRLFQFSFLVVLGWGLFAQGTITEVQGKVEVLLPGQTQWRAATVNMPLPIQATLSTGFNSRASIRLNASTLRLKPMTRITLEALAAESTNLNLRVGSVNAEVRRGDAQELNFTVRTPQATASVRGTDFEMTPYNLRATSGLVAFQTRSGSTLVPAGSDTVLGDLDIPENPRDRLGFSGVLTRKVRLAEAIRNRARRLLTTGIVINLE